MVGPTTRAVGSHLCAGSPPHKHMLRQVVRAVPRRVGVRTTTCCTRLCLLKPPTTPLFARYASSAAHPPGHGSVVTEHKNNFPKRTPCYTRAEIARHNHEGDCWIIIHNKVYNITDWIPRHPGGMFIMAHAGGDSTALFESMGHSDMARTQMNDFLIGEVTPDEVSTRADLSASDLDSPDEAIFNKYN